jgi:hypothetical protein
MYFEFFQKDNQGKVIQDNTKKSIYLEKKKFKYVVDTSQFPIDEHGKEIQRGEWSAKSA